MKKLIEDFTNHIEESLQIGNELTWNSKFKAKNIVISGLGGSGIGGTLVGSLACDQSPVAIVINKGYFIPAFVDKETLFIASSYSGNTEETLMAVDLAKQKGAEIVCLTSGGKLLELAKENGWNYIIMPSGFPPRSAFGYSSPLLFFILQKYNIIDPTFQSSFQSTILSINALENKIKEEALSIAKKIFNKYVVIYSEDTYEGVAVRFRQQINENGKNLCWHHVIPEMNHNELVGWTEKHPNVVSIFFRTSDEFNRNSARIAINQKVISQYSEILEIKAHGKDRIEQSYYLVHLTDWISYYISELKNIDVTEVRVIDFLKSELSKV